LQLELDGAWSPVPAKGELAALGVRNLDVFAPVAGLPGRAWIARAPAGDRTLVPASVRARLTKPLGKPQRTSIAGHTAWSYGTVGLRSGGQLELSVLPTSAGMMLIGCEARKSWWSTVTGCTRSVRAVGGASTVLPSGALPFRARVGRVLSELNRKRLWAGRALLHARTPGGQRAAALRIARGAARRGGGARADRPEDRPCRGRRAPAERSRRRLRGAGERRRAARPPGLRRRPQADAPRRRRTAHRAAPRSRLIGAEMVDSAASGRGGRGINHLDESFHGR
jgi:hypothetical protein